MGNYREGYVKFESYKTKMLMEDVVKLVSYLQGNHLGLIFKVAIGGEEFDV